MSYKQPNTKERKINDNVYRYISESQFTQWHSLLEHLLLHQIAQVIIAAFLKAIKKVKGKCVYVWVREGGGGIAKTLGISIISIKFLIAKVLFNYIPLSLGGESEM